MVDHGRMSRTSPQPVVIDAALRFARSNPELVRYAEKSAPIAGASVDQLLRIAIDRIVAVRAKEVPVPGAGEPSLTVLRSTG